MSNPLIRLVDLMRILDLVNLLPVAQNAGFFIGAAGVLEGSDAVFVMKAGQSEQMSQLLTRVEATCAEMGFTASAASCRRLLAEENLAESPLVKRRELWNELYGRLSDELAASLVTFIEPDKVRFYNESELFGEEVTKRFPSAQVEIEEAGKCYALNRSTACVFHLMRALEVPLRLLAKELGTDYAPSWDAYLKAIHAAITQVFPNKTREHAKKQEYFSGLEGQLRAIKTAWRNPTMHDVAKVYTEEMAAGLLALVGAFMREAARELQEPPIITLGEGTDAL